MPFVTGWVILGHPAPLSTQTPHHWRASPLPGVPEFPQRLKKLPSNSDSFTSMLGRGQGGRRGGVGFARRSPPPPQPRHTKRLLFFPGITRRAEKGAARARDVGGGVGDGVNGWLSGALSLRLIYCLGFLSCGFEGAVVLHPSES